MSILVETRERMFEYIQDKPPDKLEHGLTWLNDTSFTDDLKFNIRANNIWKSVFQYYTFLFIDFAVDNTTVLINQPIQFLDKSVSAKDILSRTWDFGDGTTSTDRNPIHQYSSPGQYTVSLTMTNTVNTQDTRTITNFITVANDPGANFIASTIADHINANIQFIDQSTSNGTITSWQWDFGDGNTSNIQNPTHQYNSPGQYTVSLTVTDEFGSDTMTRTNYIAIDVPPTAEFISDKQVINASHSVQFIDKSIFHGTMKSWLWDFGDGSTSTLQFPVHRYNSPGQYTVSLTVTDEYGSNTEMSPNHIVVNINGTGYEYGYAMSGHNESNYSSAVDRITFPFDSGTATHVGNLSINRGWSAGCNSSNYGYCMGGYGLNAVSIIDRITFPFDSGTATHVGNLSSTNRNIAGCNSSNYGYIMGGYDEINHNHYSTIDRITFPFDSGIATHIGNLSGSKFAPDCCNSTNYGYSMGGSETSIIDRIIFPFDFGVSSYVGNLTIEKHAGTGFNSTNYGYSVGGWNDVIISFSTIDRITFPFDSGTATHVGDLTSIRTFMFAGCNSTNYGYSMGGYDESDQVSIIDRITFPFDSGVAVHIGNLSENRHGIAGCDGTDFVTLFV